MQVSISVQQDAFNPARELEKFEDSCGGDAGAVVSFTGRVRNATDGQLVTSLNLEHYPGMTEKQIQKIVDEAIRRWPLAGVCVLHRYGEMLPGEAIVFIAVSASHREAAFDACAFLIDWIKTRAPFWKYERDADGCKRWVEARSIDDKRAESWLEGG